MYVCLPRHVAGFRGLQLVVGAHLLRDADLCCQHDEVGHVVRQQWPAQLPALLLV